MKLQEPVILPIGELDAAELVDPGAGIVTEVRTHAEVEVLEGRKVRVRCPLDVRALDPDVDRHSLGDRKGILDIRRCADVVTDVLDVQR